MDLKYSNACKEVVMLFDYFLDENDLSKIPEKQIKHLRENANQQYTYIVDESKMLEEQEISKEAKAIILSLYKKYFATAEQKRKVDEIVELLDRKKNIKKITNTGFNDLESALKYENRIEASTENKTIGSTENSDKYLIKSENIWKKIMNKISNFFHLK